MTASQRLLDIFTDVLWHKLLGIYGLVVKWIVRISSVGDNNVKIRFFDFDFSNTPFIWIDNRNLTVLYLIIFLPSPLLFLFLFKFLAICKRLSIDVLFRLFLFFFELKLHVKDIIKDGMLRSIREFTLCVGSLERHLSRSFPWFFALYRHIKRLLALYFAIWPKFQVFKDLGLHLLSACYLVLATHILDNWVVAIFNGMLRSSPLQLSRN